MQPCRAVNVRSKGASAERKEDWVGGNGTLNESRSDGRNVARVINVAGELRIYGHGEEGLRSSTAIVIVVVVVVALVGCPPRNLLVAQGSLAKMHAADGCIFR